MIKKGDLVAYIGNSRRYLYDANGVCWPGLVMERSGMESALVMFPDNPNELIETCFLRPYDAQTLKDYRYCHEYNQEG
jgi:hypothetical protein